MAEVYAFLADGLEEVECLAAVDVLIRGGVSVKLISISDRREVTGSHGFRITADAVLDEVDLDGADAYFLPGGMPGTLHLEQSPAVACALETARRQGAYVCAICAAPSILGHKGLLRGRKAVCFPGYEQELEGARVLTEPVVTDGTVITARGAGVAVDFGLEIAARLVSPERAEQIRKSMQCR